MGGDGHAVEFVRVVGLSRVFGPQDAVGFLRVCRAFAVAGDFRQFESFRRRRDRRIQNLTLYRLLVTQLR